MNKLHAACYCLIASACLLAGLLLVTAGDRLPSAQASLVLNKDTFTFLTVRARGNDDAVFVLDSVNEKLLIYRTELRGNGGAIKLAALVDVPKQIFAGDAPGGPNKPR